ncbi:baculoviral IAP repeat-containing protein 5a [Denticeps clupeoides]|uniref:Uncharacterized protein n=1 Tax=Denticeps clupeoides TaxID=299321 RepID=A0AAY4AUC6_9TELE|nr:baculoviral IAP repeat-containing protein 5-like [Denticeps clupeoides]
MVKKEGGHACSSGRGQSRFRTNSDGAALSVCVSSMDPMSEENLKMYFQENRLQTYSGWPFDEDCSCTAENMAKAGFIHTPSDNSPDIAQCFFCYKELEGWEPDDDPVKEHKSHSPACHFILLQKSVKELTVEELLKLEKERQKFRIKKSCNQEIEKFEDAAKLKRNEIVKIAMDG